MKPYTMPHISRPFTVHARVVSLRKDEVEKHPTRVPGRRGKHPIRSVSTMKVYEDYIELSYVYCRVTYFSC